MKFISRKTRNLASKILFNNIIIFMSSIISLSSVRAQVIETNDAAVIAREAAKLSKDDMVIFDVKEVLLASKSQVLNHQFKYKFKEFLARVEQEKGKEEARRLEAIAMQEGYDPVLVDERIPEIIKTIQGRNIKTIALTGGYAGSLSFINKLEDLRLKYLRGLNIDFSLSFPIKEMKFDSIIKDPAAPAPFYKEGIIFTSGYSKGYVLEDFLRQLNFKPKKILFVDNRTKHIEDIKEYAAKAGIDYIGIYYNKANEQYDIKEWDLPLAEKKLAYLKDKGVWLSDEEAKNTVYP